MNKLNNESFINKIILFLLKILIIFLFLFLLVIPTKYDNIIFFLIYSIIFLSIINIIITGSLSLHKQIIIWIIFLVLIGSFFTTYGIFNNNIGAIPNSKVYILYPLIYSIIISRFYETNFLKIIHKLLIISDLLICVYIILFLLNYLKILPNYLFINLNLGQSIRFYKGYMEFNLYSLSSLIFLIPYLITLHIQDKYKLLGIKKFIVSLSLILSIVLSIMSGRRMLILLIFFTPFLLLIFYNFFPIEERKCYLLKTKKLILYIFYILFFSIFIILIFDLNIKNFFIILINAFNYKKDLSANLRYIQFLKLISEWTKKPLLGYGFGATIKYLIRSETMPWAFELTYISLLHQTGIVGLVLYFFSIVWIYYKSFKIFKNNSIFKYHLLPILSGTTSFLLANATNPYLAKFSYIWVIFLPIGIINLYLLEQKNAS